MTVKITLERDFATKAARIASHMPEYTDMAESIVARMKKTARSWGGTGAFADSIHMRPEVHEPSGVIDYVVYSNDRAAYPIEFGYVTKTGRVVKGKMLFTTTARRSRRRR